MRLRRIFAPFDWLYYLFQVVFPVQLVAFYYCTTAPLMLAVKLAYDLWFFPWLTCALWLSPPFLSILAIALRLPRQDELKKPITLSQAKMDASRNEIISIYGQMKKGG